MAVYTCSNLLYDGLRRVHFWRTRKATGGSTTTIVNTNDTSIEDDQAYAGGTALIRRDAGGANAAPEAEFARITSYDGGTQTFTIEELTSGVSSGDRYVVATNRIELEEYIELMNDALQMFDFPYVNTSITSASNQTEYTLPVLLKQHDLLLVEYVGNTADSNDQGWVELTDWKIVPAAAGSTSTIILPQLPADRTVRIWYKGKHPLINAYNDVVNELLDPMLARAAFVERIYNRLDEETQHQADPFREGYNKAKAELEEAMTRYRIELPHRRPRMLSVSGSHIYPYSGEPDRVRI